MSNVKTGLTRSSSAATSGRRKMSSGTYLHAPVISIVDSSLQVVPHVAIDRQHLIAEAAYRRAETRCFTPGHELDDWLAAEAEVNQRLAGEGRASS